jgi:hypothetical protein
MQDGRFLRDPRSSEIMKNINAAQALEYAAGVSSDELSLYFTRARPSKSEIGIYVATRSSRTAPFDTPLRIEAIQGFVEAPTVAPDNCAILLSQENRRPLPHLAGKENRLRKPQIATAKISPHTRPTRMQQYWKRA